MKIDVKNVRLDAVGEIPGILFGLCSDREAGNWYAGGTSFGVYEFDPRDLIAIAEAPPASGSKTPAEAPSAGLRVTGRWTHHASYVSSLVWHAGRVISAGYDGEIVWTEAATGKLIRKIPAHEGWVRKLTRLPGGKLLASAGDEMKVKLWICETGELHRTLDGHARKTPEGYATALYCVAAHPDGQQVAAADRAGEVIVWNVESGAIVQRFRAPAFYTFDAAKRARAIGGVRGLAFSPDGKSLALSGIGPVTNVDGFVGPCRVEVWEWQKPERTFLGQDKHQAILNHVAWLPDGTIVAAGGGDGGGILAFWDGKNEAPIHKVKPKGHLQTFEWTKEGDGLIAAGYGGIQLWRFGN